MALRPTGPGDSRIPARREGRAVVPSRVDAPVAPSPAARAAPERGYRLKTATTDAEIERQIQRLMVLIANDNIDPDAPPGSYLNLLI
ncbi:hypothetical protein T8K17_19725 [Thalassobaculum sp. OXR-137]|uniref:hypothetical protein n=1 Tax=Thalassobaculum sp. OXR-137 TaxID=3100173 RepID=UPI002AC9DCA6|nr:hypothetical protein [Thalassobaculum sp. OXR-137]WPZ33451.1 hypothetical protein T8K17_19725 [Thalassobaculum sp. OXR-137]